MRNANTIFYVLRDRGAKRLPVERFYRQLFDPLLYLGAYAKIYRNSGAMTKGTNNDTVDGMSLEKIHRMIDLLRQEKWQWKPVRRVCIPKANGKRRPLGIPGWSDKLLQEVLRGLLEAYYEPRFSNNSHGFRPDRSCHTALRTVQDLWTGTTWFIEGDIKGCFDNVDHDVLLGILAKDIHDGRFIQLIRGLLKAGYMEDWRRTDTISGTPQGGILSPLLANIYLHELDDYVETSLIPQHTRGNRRSPNQEYRRTLGRLSTARRRNHREAAKALQQKLRQLPSVDYFDPAYRRLRYVRYADDFLLGFVGTKAEAEVIRDGIRDFLREKLKLELSLEKTLVTHAHDDKARFLGYEITNQRSQTRISDNGKRATNGRIALRMPQKVVSKVRQMYQCNGTTRHRAELLAETDYTIIQRYQSVLLGLYNYYCMAINVSKGMSAIRWILETSLTKTLAHKFKVSVAQIYQKYGVEVDGLKALQVTIPRDNKPALVATFAGLSMSRNREGLGSGPTVYTLEAAWFQHSSDRSEVVQRLLAGQCELCDATDRPLAVHHVRKLADLHRPGRPPVEEWQKIMAARKRKTLVVCHACHEAIHRGRYDGARFR